jgi:hypothetical protein
MGLNAGKMSAWQGALATGYRGNPHESMAYSNQAAH